MTFSKNLLFKKTVLLALPRAVPLCKRVRAEDIIQIALILSIKSCSKCTYLKKIHNRSKIAQNLTTMLGLSFFQAEKFFAFNSSIFFSLF